MEEVRNIRLQELDQTDSSSQKRYDMTLSIDASEVKIGNKLAHDYITELYREGVNNITVFGNDIKKKSPFRIGGVFSLIYVDDEPLLIIGPQYYMSFLLAVIILGLTITFYYLLYPYLSLFLRLISYCVFLFEFVTQTYCTFINPGIPSRNNFISERIIHLIGQGLQVDPNYLNKYRICKKCNIIVPADQPITHCDICNICVESMIFFNNFNHKYLDMDHHCMWIGKCIGKNNLWTFYLFLCALTLLFLFYFICVGYVIYVRIYK